MNPTPPEDRNQQLINTAKSGHTQTFKFLLDTGADITTQNHTPLRCAYLHDRQEILKIILGKYKTSLLEELLPKEPLIHDVLKKEIESRRTKQRTAANVQNSAPEIEP